MHLVLQKSSSARLKFAIGHTKSKSHLEVNMGLDMYAYAASKAGQQNEIYEGAEIDETTREFANKTVTKPREIAYWRTHPNLHGWMERLAEEKGLEYNSFNGIELELTWEDLDELERAVTHRQLPSTQGFFFGNGADDHYYDHDLKFIKDAKAEAFLGAKIFYNSSW